MLTTPIRTALCIFAACVGSALPAATRPPNIVILLADDQGWGDLSVNGNVNVRTPRIDSLARDGVTLKQFYVCPVCSPTRAEFLTGRYYPRAGVQGVDSGKERLDLAEKTIADTFKAAGYTTGIFGKWHNGAQWPYHPNARGFDEFYGFTEGHWGYYFDPPLEENGRTVRGRGYIADDLTDHAIAFIERNRERPFLCYVPFNTPHSPFCVPDEYWNRYKDSPVTQRGRDGEREDLTITRCVLAMTDNLDWNVGRILRRLDELELRNNTLVVYFSDNGPNSWRWNGGMKGRKTSTDEGGLRAPCFIRWPARLAAGRTVTEITAAIDLLPTLARLAGVARVGDRPLDGRDLSPLLFGTTRDWPERLIFSTWANRVSVRSPRYRLDDRGALFDLENDPRQGTDVASQHAEVAGRLSAAVAAWKREMFPPGVSGEIRPIPVGYREFPRAILTAGDGVPHGTVRRSNRFPNSTYFTNWTSTNDTMTWDIEVNELGNYSVAIDYTCAPADVGATIELEFHGARLAGRVTTAWDPPLLDREDRNPRQESFLKEFRSLPLGIIRLEKGRGLLTLRATRIAGQAVIDVRNLTLALEKP